MQKLQHEFYNLGIISHKLYFARINENGSKTLSQVDICTSLPRNTMRQQYHTNKLGRAVPSLTEAEDHFVR